MKGLHTGTEKAEPTWKEWRREFCWEEEPVLAVSGVRLELPEGIPGLRRLERWCRRLEGAWAARWERELYPRACTAARQAREGMRIYSVISFPENSRMSFSEPG